MAESTYIASGKVTVFEVLFSVFCLKIIFQLIFFFFLSIRGCLPLNGVTGGRTKNPLRSTIKNSEIHPIHVLRHQKAAEARRTEDAKTLEGWQTSLPVRSSWWNCVCPSCPSNTSFKKVNFILKYNINENPQTRSVWLTEFFWGKKKKNMALYLA